MQCWESNAENSGEQVCHWFMIELTTYHIGHKGQREFFNTQLPQIYKAQTRIQLFCSLLLAVLPYWTDETQRKHKGRRESFAVGFRQHTDDVCHVLRCCVLVKDLKEYGAIVFRGFEISKDKETFGQVPRCTPTKVLHLFVVLLTRVVLNGNAPSCLLQ